MLNLFRFIRNTFSSTSYVDYAQYENSGGHAEIKLVVMAGRDHHLSTKIGRIATDTGFRCIRTNDYDRVEQEMKKPGCCLIIDMKWDDAQSLGMLKKLINIGKICGNLTLCMCPNQDEDLKKLSRAAGASQTFIRYDLDGRFKKFMKAL